MEKYTKEQKIEVAKFFEEGFTAREIFEVTQIPIGTLYRWKSEAKPDPKAQRADNLGSSDNLGSILAELASVNEQLADVKEQLAEALKWINAKKKREAKELEYTDKRPTFQFKRAGPM